MKAPTWVLHETILALHGQLLAEFGGADGIRDAALLESALARPQNLFAYETPSTFALAASYAFGLVKNHPFVDGNKRIGFAVSALFLELNGYTLEAPETEAVIETLALASSKSGETHYASWLERWSRRLATRR